MRWNLMALTALLMTPVVVQAQGDPGFPGPRGQGPGPHPFGPQLVHYLELTPDQEQSIRALQEEHRRASREQQQTIRDIHRRLEDALESSTPDPGMLGEMLLEMRAHRKEMSREREAMEQQIVGLLDAEQELKLRHFKELMRLRRDDHRREGRERVRER